MYKHNITSLIIALLYQSIAICSKEAVLRAVQCSVHLSPGIEHVNCRRENATAASRMSKTGGLQGKDETV